jgi:hypothetical protein
MRPSGEVADALAAIEHYFERGWTDGLPVVPPTEGSVHAMLAAAAVAPDEVVAEVPTRRRRLTAEKVAVNAVMAGCRPEYMPVLLAAVRTWSDPALQVHGPTASTSGMGLLLIVHGPVARRLGINAGENLFGPGCRANATIGRALRLVLVNGLGAVPGALDRSVLGHPGKYTYVIAELEAESPWAPLHVDRGLPRETSAVTLFACEGPHQVACDAREPEQVLEALADVVAAGGRVAARGQEFGVVVGPNHAALLARRGWSKAEVRRFLVAHAVRSAGDLRRMGKLPPDLAGSDDAEPVPAVERPEDLLLVVAGGDAGAYSAVMPGWAGRRHSAAVTRRLEEGP